MHKEAKQNVQAVRTDEAIGISGYDAERNVQAKQLELQRQKVMEEERRKTIEREAYLNEKQARYQDKLERERFKEQQAAQKFMQDR